MTNNINIDDFNIIKDIDMRKALLDFFNTKGLVGKSALDYKYIYLRCFENIELKNLTRLTFCDIWNDLNLKSCRSHACTTLLRFLGFLLKNNLYKGNDLEKLKYFTDLLYTSFGQSSYNCNNFFDKEKSIDRFWVYSYIAESTELDSEGKPIFKTYYKLVDTNTENKFIVKLLADFYESSSRKDGINRRLEFAESFINSNDSITTFSTISDFTYEVFEKQFEFYKDKSNELKELVKFYLYLTSLNNCENFFDDNSPIDSNMMHRTDFTKLFKEGYKLVKYNPHENFPDHDKWLVKPNSLEKTSTMVRESTYLKISFVDVKNDIYIPYLKHFFWASDTSLYGRRATNDKLILFLNFLIDYKNMSINKSKNNDIDFNSISVTEMFSYRTYIESQGFKSATKNAHYSSITMFLRFCKTKGYLSFNDDIFDFLDRHARPRRETTHCVEDIPDDELKVLEEQLRNNADDSLLNKLYYIIFHMAIETEFRISQLTSLKISEIKEGMKENQFFIHSITKTSYHEKEIQPISLYAKRHLDTAIKCTEELRELALPSKKDYIFILNNRSTIADDITPVTPTSFNNYLKKQCESLGLKKYTASNLRDTHMTKAVEYGFKQNLSEMEIGTLTNHTNLATTNNFYVNGKIKSFAEATYGISIGNVDIKGTILNTTATDKNFTKADEVDDGCGFCKEDICKIETLLGCAMCDGFIVTLDRIPFFEEKMKELDRKIMKQEIQHEREHLYTIKRLYVAYLTKLYELKEELLNKNNN